MKHLPHKTIGRLSQYRRALLLCLEQGKTHIFSHEIAKMIHITAVQVRRDIMLIGYSGTIRIGYNIKELTELIGSIIDSEEVINVGAVGMGRLGKSMVSYFLGKRTRLTMAACFDNDPHKIGTDFKGIEIYNVKDLKKIVKEKNIKIGIMTVTAPNAIEVCNQLVEAKVKGILNYSPKPISVPKNIFLEEIDMITSLEKVAFYVKTHDD